MKPLRQSGFTLLELAIIIVIIGLIAGSFFVGQSLIRSAQIRDTMGQVSQYVLAYNNFMDKYKALPGDLTTATNLWGIDSGGCPSAVTGLPATTYSTAVKKETCNGDGDGYIAASAATSYEMFRSWQQLSASGMLNGTISGSFNGISDTSAGTQNVAVIGVNVPASSVRGGGFTTLFMSVAADESDTNRFGFIHGHIISLGTAVSGSYTYGALLTPAEALSVDTKMDDGLPGSGTVQPPKNALNPNCTTTDVIATSLYKISNSGVACSLMFITSF